jgi:hypothetical protein
MKIWPDLTLWGTCRKLCVPCVTTYGVGWIMQRPLS